MKAVDTTHAPVASLIKRPFVRFAQLQASEGILLLACTVLALAWANSPWSHGYFELWHTKLTVAISKLQLSYSLHHWINDGLMAIFFFLVGLEIKREALVGELASMRKAGLPIMAAVGGMIVPAGVYALLNRGGPGLSGWGIPMATDIAFALGVMTMLGRAVPVSLKVFLTALAIVDDIGAVLVIAFFYTSELHAGALLMSAGFLISLILANRAGARNPLIYLLLGLGLWLGFMQGGIHATLAGVVLAMTIPARARLRPDEFVKQGRELLDQFDRADVRGATLISSERQQSIVQACEKASRRVQSPLGRMESTLHPWVSYLIMPVFALANAGVPLSSHLVASMSEPVPLGVMLGLVLGKPIGVVGLSALALKLGWVDLPRHTSWRQMLGVGCLAGIGFTMSLFIANLALDENHLQLAKAAILGGSLVSGVAGWLLLRRPRDKSAG